ncbi:MAG: IspD/TarI family cytidylyltransferase [Mycobacteriales bacterium]
MALVSQSVSPANERLPQVAAVVLAGGSGSRLGAARNKVYLPVAGRPVIAWSVDALRHTPGLARLVVVVRAGDEELLAAAEVGDVEVVLGGTTRTGSELAALQHLAPAIEDGCIGVVSIHDGARPLASAALVTAVTDAAVRHRGAVPGLPLDKHLVEVDGQGVVRRRLTGAHATMQTPQAFAAGPLLAAYRQAGADGYDATDTAGCIERYSDIAVRLVPGEETNIKVTVGADLDRADALLRRLRH